MSIEALIKVHTEALLDNTEAVKLLTLSLAGRTPKAEDKTAKVEKQKVDTAELEAKREKADGKALASKPQEDEKPNSTVSIIEETSAPAVPYETVRALVLKLAPTQRDAIKALNAKHGIANLKVLLDKEDDFSTVNDQKKLEAVYADLQALEV